jgi:hypothetical protein
MKNKINHNIVLLLTATVNINGKEFTTLTDKVARRNSYIETIQYYLKHYLYPIVFVENSNEDISSEFSDAILHNRLEVLTFNGNNYPNHLGKGLGEMRCIEHGIIHSRLITANSFVFKITGRYVIENFNCFTNILEAKPEVELIADLTNNFKFSAAAIFGFKPFFASTYLFKNALLLNDSNGYFFEHALAKAVLEAVANNINFHIFKHYPKIKALSGTTGKPYKISFFWRLPRVLKYIIRYYIVIR